MRTLAAIICVGVLLPLAAQAKKPHCTLRVHAEANELDGEVFATRFTSSVTGRKVVIEKVPTISERDVSSFRVYEAGNGTYGVLFLLDDHGRLALDTLSVEKRGRFLYIFVNGRPISELQIDKRVSDGKLYLASGLSLADIALMRKEWPVLGPRRR